MRIDIVSIFPEMFERFFGISQIKRAQEKSLLEILVHDLRAWTCDRHKSVDDRPFGGGAGMILMVEPIYKAVSKIKKKSKERKQKVVLLTPQGKVFDQEKAEDFSRLSQLILICGRYEGVDERVRKYIADEEISLGDFILSGGEVAAMAVIDSVVRLIPGVVGKKESLQQESFSKIEGKRLLEYPQYTRPENFKGWKVPKVLLSGNHAKIAKWRKTQGIKRTSERRPDLLVCSE